MQNAKLTKEWWAFTKPNKKIYFLVLATIIIHRLCLVIVPIFAAMVITNLIENDFSQAVFYLYIGLGISVVRTLVMHINYMLYPKLLRDPYHRLQQEIADKIFTSRPTNFKNMPKSSLINMIHSDVNALCDTQDLTCTKIADFIQVAMTIVALFLLDINIGFVMLGVCIMNFFILDFINKRLAVATKKKRDALDDEYESVSSIYDIKDNIVFDSTKTLFKKQLQQKSTKYLKAVSTDLRAKSLLENWFWLFYTTVVFAITLLLINSVKQGDMTLETYLVVVPYLLLIIDATNKFLSVFKDIRNANVHLNRIKRVLHFTDKPMLAFGKLESDFDNMGIDFVGVSASYISSPAIRDVSFSIRENDITLIRGVANSGKRTIFLLICREIMAKKGEVLINSQNIINYNKRSYEKQLTHISSKPFFIKGSVLMNLKRFEGTNQKIFKVCSDLGIHELIMALPRQYNTDITTLPISLRYMIDFARCLLANCEIILFYETPDMLKQDEKENLKKYIKEYARHKTIVFFSRSNEWSDISSKTIEIENGMVKDIKIK